jgi:hypothetical protein
MAGVCEGAVAEAVQFEQESCCEAALHTAEEAAIEAGETFRGVRLKLDKSADGADDSRTLPGGARRPPGSCPATPGDGAVHRLASLHRE